MPALFERSGMSSLDNFALEYNRGRKEVLNDIREIVNKCEYPEDLEMLIIEYLESEGA